eukprot:403368144
MLLVFGMMIIDVSQSKDKLAFVYQITRHGARASSGEDPGKFRVNPGMLTEQGMRQRLLQGMDNRFKYILQEQLLDQTYNPNQMLVRSDDVFRTIQSGYAELMGLYPPLTSNNKEGNLVSHSVMTAGEISSLKSGKGMPRLKIRNYNQMKEQLGLNSIVDGYQMIPVFNFIDANYDDDIAFKGCQWASQSKAHNKKDPATYANVLGDYLEILREPLQKAFNISDEKAQNLTFSELSGYGDKFRCEDFEGDKRRNNFTSTEVYYLRTMQRDSLAMPASEKGRQLFMTKQFSKPLEAMKKMVSQLINGEDTRDSLRFFFYSAHDDTPANAMPFLNPLNYILVDVPYGSSFTYELRYNEDCLNDKTTSADEKRKCFKVHSLYNNNPLRFDTCEQNVNSNQSSGKKALKVDSKLPVCLFDDFLNHIQKASYQGDVKEACSQPYIPGQE